MVYISGAALVHFYSALDTSTRSVEMHYRLDLERKGLASSTIKVRLAAVRRLATEASDSGLLSFSRLAVIRRVRGVKQLGERRRNWLSVEQCRRLLGRVDTSTRRGKRDAAMLGLLLGCGLRRSELVELAPARRHRRDGRPRIR